MPRSSSLGRSSATRTHCDCLMECRSVMRRAGEGEKECGALARRSFGPGASAVPMHDATDVGQTNAGAFELLRGMQPLKHAKQFVPIAHVESDSIVANEGHGRLAVPRSDGPYPGLGTREDTRARVGDVVRVPLPKRNRE